MNKNLSRKCRECGEECIVYMKAHYLGIHFVEQCGCGTSLSPDPFRIHWHRYSKKERDRLIK